MGLQMFYFPGLYTSPDFFPIQKLIQMEIMNKTSVFD